MNIPEFFGPTKFLSFQLKFYILTNSKIIDYLNERRENYNFFLN